MRFLPHEFVAKRYLIANTGLSRSGKPCFVLFFGNLNAVLIAFAGKRTGFTVHINVINSELSNKTIQGI